MLLLSTTILAEYPLLVVPAQLVCLGWALFRQCKETPFAEVGTAKAAFDRTDPDGWSRGDKLEALSLTTQVRRRCRPRLHYAVCKSTHNPHNPLVVDRLCHLLRCYALLGYYRPNCASVWSACNANVRPQIINVLLSAFCAVAKPAKESDLSLVVAMLALTCVLLPVAYGVQIVVGEWRTGRKLNRQAMGDVSTPRSPEQDPSPANQQEFDVADTSENRAVPGSTDELTFNPLTNGRQRWEPRTYTAGDIVDVETEDGTEYAATILGPSTSCDGREMRIKFADGIVDDWPVSDFRQLISGPATIESSGVEFRLQDDDSDDEEIATTVHVREGKSFWTCPVCTTIHEGATKAGFLSCEVCGAARYQQQQQQTVAHSKQQQSPQQQEAKCAAMLGPLEENDV